MWPNKWHLIIIKGQIAVFRELQKLVSFQDKDNLLSPNRDKRWKFAYKVLRITKPSLFLVSLYCHQLQAKLIALTLLVLVQLIIPHIVPTLSVRFLLDSGKLSLSFTSETRKHETGGSKHRC